MTGELALLAHVKVKTTYVYANTFCYYISRMDDLTTFLTFVQTRCGVTVERAQNKIISFISALRNLLSVQELQ